MTQTFIKDPDERQDYSVDWTTEGYLASGETISASSWTVPAGVTQYGIATVNGAATIATIWLSGGTHGQEYYVANKITTTSGRIAERSIKIICRNQ
jgi:hypothetical protein